MARETKTFEISGVTYTATQFGAKQCAKVALRVAKYYGTLADAAKSKDETAMLASLMAAISEDDFFFVSEACADATQVEDGDKTFALIKIFDAHFSGKMKDLLEWFAESLKFQLGSFSSGDLNAPNQNVKE